MDIRKAGVSDVVMVAELSVQLWPDNTLEEMKAEFDAFVRRQDVALFLAYDEGKAVGFAQCQLRHDYVEGTDSSPVGYLEGIYVEPSYRNRGCARALLHACEEWSADAGCTEFASDCELDNVQSLRFHMSVGFEEAGRNIHFRKEL